MTTAWIVEIVEIVEVGGTTVAAWAAAQIREAQTKDPVLEGEDFLVRFTAGFHPTDSVSSSPDTTSIRFFGSLRASECLSATDFTSGGLRM